MSKQPITPTRQKHAKETPKRITTRLGIEPQELPTPGAALTAPQDALTFTIAAAGTTPAAGQELQNPSEIGMIVGALSPNSTVVVEVSQDNSTFVGLVDKAGAALMVIPSSAGGYAVDGNAMGGALPYKFIRPKCGTAQTNGATITITRRITRTDPLA